MTWEPPRCHHGYIILGCPDDGCDEQNAYLAEQDAALNRYRKRQEDDAKEIVRLLTGVTIEGAKPTP